MSQPLDLKAIERKAFRSVHQDGLFDIYIGGLLLVLSLFFTSSGSWGGELSDLIMTLLGVGMVFAVFQLGKKYITVPRMGQVRFGSERQKRKIKLAWIMGVFVMVTLGLFLYSLYVWYSDGVVWTVKWNLDPSLERALVASIAALIAGISMIVSSYFKEFLRGYYMALFMGCGFFFAIWLDSPIPLIIAGAIIFIPGLVLFINFLRQHPLPPQEIGHGNS